MIVDVEREALQCLGRTSLEGLQTHSRYLRDLVNLNARALPLRRIYLVCIVYGKCYASLTEDSDAEVALPTSEQNLESFFCRINNSYINRMTLNFRPENRPFLIYMRARAHELQCEALVIKLQTIGEWIDYAIVDFLGHSVRPRHYEALMDDEASEGYVMLFTRCSLRARISHLAYRTYTLRALECNIPELLRTGTVETCTVQIYSDPRTWIVKFIEVFRAIAAGTRTVRDVTFLHIRSNSESRVEDNIHLLKDSQGSVVPAPNCALIKDWCREYPQRGRTKESPTAKRYVFGNPAIGKRLEVHRWTIEKDGTQVGLESLNYAYFLRIVDT